MIPSDFVSLAHSLSEAVAAQRGGAEPPAARKPDTGEA